MKTSNQEVQTKDLNEVIHYDFKAKKKIKNYTQYQWTDAVSGETHLYDSRRQDNIEHVKIPLWVGHDKQKHKVELMFKIEDLIDIGLQLSGDYK
jgi:hypothetical protein